MRKPADAQRQAEQQDIATDYRPPRHAITHHGKGESGFSVEHTANHVAPEFADAGERLIGHMKERRFSDLETLHEVLPKLWQTQEAMRDAKERYERAMQGLRQQEKVLIGQLSDDAKEEANSLWWVGNELYRLTAQGKVIRICPDEYPRLEDEIRDLEMER